MDKKKIVILFTRLSDYFLNVLQLWANRSNVEIYIFRRDIDKKEAPYSFQDIGPDIYLFDESDFTKYTLLEKVKEIEPDMIMCAGWSDRRYLHTVGAFKNKIPTVMTMDNQWHATIKQFFGVVVGQIYLSKIFSYVWVPGEPQVRFARKLGFKESNISKGFYVANRKNFSVETINPKRNFKKRFLFVGRYVELKGVEDLWNAFVELQEESPNEWELICIGTGPLYEKRKIHPKIKHIGFMQPYELKSYLSEGGVFVLPSHFEPWGVVVHEFALAAFPMILSDQVGAARTFLDEKNGIIFESKNIVELKKAMYKMTQLQRKELLKMGDESFKKAKKINESKWVETANTFLEWVGK